MKLVLSPLFGHVHGHIRPADKHVRVQAVIRIEGQTDTGAYSAAVTALRQLSLDHRADLLGHFAGHSTRSYFGQGDKKFITTPAAEDIRVTEMDAQDSGKVDEQPVTGFMSVAVVDPFEVVQIKKEDRCFFFIAPGPANILFEQVMEHSAVGQVGQGIMVCQLPTNIPG